MTGQGPLFDPPVDRLVAYIQSYSTFIDNEQCLIHRLSPLLITKMLQDSFLGWKKEEQLFSEGLKLRCQCAFFFGMYPE